MSATAISNTAPPIDKLGDLPPDVLLRITTHLRASDICCLRRLNKDYKLFVDLSKQVILLPKIALQQQRIKESHQVLVFTANIPISEAVARFVAHYVVVEERYTLIEASRRFYPEYLRARYGHRVSRDDIVAFWRVLGYVMLAFSSVIGRVNPASSLH
jgi:hypothetical protein